MQSELYIFLGIIVLSALLSIIVLALQISTSRSLRKADSMSDLVFGFLVADDNGRGFNLLIMNPTKVPAHDLAVRLTGGLEGAQFIHADRCISFLPPNASVAIELDQSLDHLLEGVFDLSLNWKLKIGKRSIAKNSEYKLRSLDKGEAYVLAGTEAKVAATRLSEISTSLASLARTARKLRDSNNVSSD